MTTSPAVGSVRDAGEVLARLLVLGLPRPTEGRVRHGLAVHAGGAAHEMNVLAEVEVARVALAVLWKMHREQLEILREELDAAVIAPQREVPIAEPVRARARKVVGRV